MSEYYIRQPEENEARGPYTIPKITDLIESGKADRETLYYDEDREDWIPIVESQSLSDILFPEKKHLNLRAKEVADTINADESEARTVTVDEMLAASEGRTEDTKHLKTKGTNMERAAAISLPALGVMMILSAISNIYPGWAIIQLITEEKDYLLLLQHPKLILGCLDAFLALCCFLAVTDAFPVIRFRAMVGLGYFAYIAWSWGDTNQLIAVAVGSIAAFICTITLNLYVMIVCAAAGILGMGALAVFSIMGS
ncbi:hypothetical protein [Rubellicoccus peritrichatus]|uniref:GYF domain-containing protein n=1 Tax=Rubellicoccus peritrichatus TaxID=3080537 RepID=A0AAQ3QTB7_9BACT|nr:hypothetical protein [Puniceicoccus sp. CR14]WOO43538.1 hypothetical protein RZN69_10605 [Puniceicoccus sp. CR14]